MMIRSYNHLKIMKPWVCMDAKKLYEMMKKEREPNDYFFNKINSVGVVFKYFLRSMPLTMI